MKKILCLLLAISLCISLNIAFAAEETAESEVIVYSEDIKILNSFGIFETDFFKTPSDFITRGQLAYISDVMSGMRIKYDKISYPDVTLDYKYASSIEAAAQMKFMDGYIDGTFKADEKITLDQAFKAMVVLTGYSFMAEKENGDYSSIAYSLGMGAGIKSNVKDNVTFEQMATIIMNTFDTEIVGVGYSDGKLAGAVSEETLLDSVFNIYQERGTIDDTYVSSLNSAVEQSPENSFSVNGEFYNCGSYDIELLLGYQVEFFYKYNKEDESNTLLYLFDENELNEIIGISTEDYYGISDRKLKYYQKGQLKTFEIKSTCDIILNGKLQDVYDESIFDITNGEIYIVTNNKNRKTFVSIKSISEFVVGFVGQSQITTKIGGKTIEINDSHDFNQNLIRDGKSTDITKVAENNVLEIYTDGLLSDGNVDLTDAKFLAGTVTAGKITGTIVAINDDYIRIDAQAYEISETLKDAVENEYVEALAIGTQYDFLLNSYGEIAYYIRKNTTNERFGIFLKTNVAENDSGGIGGFVRILEDDGAVTHYEIPEKIKVDGVAKSTPEAFVRNFNSMAKSVKDSETGEIMNIVLPPKRFIRYITKEVPDEGNIIVKENADGTKTEEQVMKTVLTELDTLVENVNPKETDMVYEHTVPYGSWKRYKSSMMGNAFRVESSTKLFYIPRITSRTADEDTTTDTLTWTGLDVEDPDNYGVGSSKFNKAGLSTWFGDIYTYMMNEESVPRVAAAYPRKQAGVSNIDIDGSASGSGRIAGFEEVVTEDGDVAIQMTVGSTNVFIDPSEADEVLQCAKQPYKADGETPRIAGKGDFIRYWKDVKGYLIGLDICISMDDMRAGIPKINTLNAAGTSFVGYQDQYVVRFLYGMPYRVGTSTMKIAKKAMSDSASGEYMYDSDGNLMFDFDSGASSFEVFPANASVYLMEENSNGEIFWNQVTKGEIRTFEDYGYDADRVVVVSGYGGISYVAIVRLYN